MQRQGWCENERLEDQVSLTTQNGEEAEDEALAETVSEIM